MSSFFDIKVLAGEVFLSLDDERHLLCPTIKCAGDGKKLARETICGKCLEEFGHGALTGAIKIKESMRSGRLPFGLTQTLDDAAEDILRTRKGTTEALVAAIRQTNSFFCLMDEKLIVKAIDLAHERIVAQEKQKADNFNKAKSLVKVYLAEHNSADRNASILAGKILEMTPPDFRCTLSFLTAAANAVVAESRTKRLSATRQEQKSFELVRQAA